MWNIITLLPLSIIYNLLKLINLLIANTSEKKKYVLHSVNGKYNQYLNPRNTVFSTLIDVLPSNSFTSIPFYS